MEPNPIVYYDGTQSWYVDNHLHRLDGPARIYADGYQAWWICGQNITPQVEAWMSAQGLTWPWDADTQIQFLLTFT